jgi:hypothetical protein
VTAVAQPRFQLVPGARLSGVVGGGGVGWRLLGSNNRELGRSALSYADAEAALAAIGRVRVLATHGEAHIVHDPSSGHWAWHLEDGGPLVANSGRGFRHERECRYNLEQFRHEAPTAPAAETDVPLEFPWQRTVLSAVPTEATS